LSLESEIVPVPIIVNDFFFRANASTLGATWSQYDGGGGWSVATNTAQATPTTKAYAAFVAKSTAAGQRVMAAENPLNASASWGVFLRGVAPFNTGSDNYYSLEIIAGANPATLRLFKTVAGVKTQLGTDMTITRASGAILQLDATGSSLQAWYNNTLLQTVTDLALGGSAASKSAGIAALTAGQQVNLVRADLRGDRVYPLIPQTFTINPEFRVEITEYDSGFVQRNLIWRRPRRIMTIGHDVLQDADKVTLWNFFMGQQAGFSSFLVQDPSWVINPIVQETFAVADGVSTVYKVDVDFATSITTFTDGVQDSSQPVVSLPLGIVVYASPPAGGSILSYSAPYTSGASPFYRVYFRDNDLKWERRPPNFWKVQANLAQEKEMISGAAQ
jgi:hypothetical protein